MIVLGLSVEEAINVSWQEPSCLEIKIQMVWNGGFCKTTCVGW